MPLFSSLASKAQSALSASPLAQHLPPSLSGHHPAGEQTASQEQGASAPSGRHHGLESIQHSFRTLQVQYSSGRPETRQLQMMITAQKGVSLDFDNAARDSKTHSKELYLWGQSEGPDVKDVTDRVAFINFVHGSLTEAVASAINQSRTPFKRLRDAEAALAPRRNLRAGIVQQIAKFKAEGGRAGGVDLKIAQLEDQLRKAEYDDAPMEREVELLKRSAVRESETVKWEALREYGEKLVLLAQASQSLVTALPTDPPSEKHPYQGAQATAAVRASLQRALDNYKTGHVQLQNLAPHASAADDTRSFGETHADELSAISSAPLHHGHHSPHPVTVPLGHHDEKHPAPASSPPAQPAPPSNAPAAAPVAIPTPIPAVAPAAAPPVGSQSPPLNPATLNNAPAPIPSTSPAGKFASAFVVAASISPPHSQAILPSVGAPEKTPAAAKDTPPVTTAVNLAPTVAETGTPVAAGPEGPGPQAGTLRPTGDVPASNTPGYGLSAHHESAEEEKARLKREIEAADARAAAEAAAAKGVPPASIGGLQASSSVSRPTRYGETAEEEKKRLEREERERVLRGETARQDTQPTIKEEGGEAAPPPAYADF